MIKKTNYYIVITFLLSLLIFDIIYTRIENNNTKQFIDSIYEKEITRKQNKLLQKFDSIQYQNLKKSQLHYTNDTNN